MFRATDQDWNCWVDHLTTPTNERRGVLKRTYSHGMREDRIVMARMQKHILENFPDVQIILRDQDMISTEFGTLILGENMVPHCEDKLKRNMIL